MAEKIKVGIMIRGNIDECEGYTKQIYRNSVEALNKINMNLGELHDYLYVTGSVGYYGEGMNEPNFDRSFYDKIIDIVVAKYNVHRLKDIIINRFCYYMQKEFKCENDIALKSYIELFDRLGYNSKPVYIKYPKNKLSDNYITGYKDALRKILNSEIEKCKNFVEDCHNYSEEDVKMTKIMYGQSVLYNKMAEPETFVVSFFDIDRVIFNNPATIVFWKDGTKTVVKAHGGDAFNPEVGLMACFTKKALGNKYEYYGKFNKIINKYNKESEKKVKQAAKKTTRKTVKK